MSEEEIIDFGGDDLFQVDPSYYRQPKPNRVEIIKIDNTDIEIKVSILGKYLISRLSEVEIRFF